MSGTCVLRCFKVVKRVFYFIMVKNLRLEAVLEFMKHWYRGQRTEDRGSQQGPKGPSSPPQERERGWP